MSGSLLCEYVLSQKKEKAGSLPADGAVVKSIVTTNLVDEIAKAYNVKLIEVLTGFKWIGKEILGFEQSGKGTYLFGLEESYGCLIGTYARDKDAIVATMALCEAAAYYKTQGKTLWDAMIEMYEQFGYYKDAIQSVTMKGIEGLQKIQEIMNSLRQNPPAEFAGHKVVAVRDYKADTITDVITGAVKPTGLPNSNVLYYELTDDAWVCLQVATGTEGYASADYMEVTEGYRVAEPVDGTAVDEDTTSEETSTTETKKASGSVEENKQSTQTTTEKTSTTQQTTTEATTQANNSSNIGSSSRTPVSLSDADINLMAAVMTLECGNESYEGQLAVANVILNRLQSGAWGSTISSVVYAANQFSVVSDSRLQGLIQNGAQASCIQAARDACAGNNNIGDLMSFRPARYVDTSTLGTYKQIGNHVFFK